MLRIEGPGVLPTVGWLLVGCAGRVGLEDSVQGEEVQIPGS